MIRPTPTAGALLGGFCFALLFGVVESAHAEAADDAATAASATAAAELPAELPPPALATTPTTTTTTAPPPAPAPPPPALDPVDIPPAFGAQDAGGFLWSFVKSMLMLAAVLALIYLVLHKGLGRLVQRTQMGRRMRVVERIALDQRRALYLVEVDGQEVLLAGSEGGVVAVDLSGKERDRPATSAAPAARFSTELGKTGRAPPITGADDGKGEGQSRVHGAGGVKAREGVEG